jgi:hypothetical protein
MKNQLQKEGADLTCNGVSNSLGKHVNEMIEMSSGDSASESERDSDPDSSDSDSSSNSVDSSSSNGDSSDSSDYSSGDSFVDDVDQSAEPKETDASQYIVVLQDQTPKLKRVILRKKSALRNISRRREEQRIKSKLKEDLNLSVDLSHCNDDSYPGRSGGDASDKNKSESEHAVDNSTSDGSSKHSESTVQDEPAETSSPSLTGHDLAVAQRIVSDIFTKPKQSGALAQRIRNNREAIKKLSDKIRAKGIEESFVVSTRARRLTKLVHILSCRNVSIKGKLLAKTWKVRNHYHHWKRY